jgi:hypothetical protein
MLNPFFLQGSETEQGLVQDLINEQLRMYGVDVYYLPRKYVTEKTIIKEVIQSTFDINFPIEAYIENYEGYGDNTTILSKFGIQALNELRITISKERFENYITPLIQDQEDTKLATRPKEGDLIFFPLGNRLFEIKFVEHEQPFYQLRKTYVYTLKCELFRYEDEIIDTTIDQIDQNLKDPRSIPEQFGPTQTLTLVGSSSTAYAIGNIVNGGIRSIIVSNRGGGYTSIPRVAISSAPSGGKTGIAIAKMIDGIVVCNQNVNSVSKSVQSVEIINSGYGYTVSPKVAFIGGGGSGAYATAIINNGVVGIITVTNGGSGYVNPPTVSFNGFNLSPASAEAIVSSSGTITSIRIKDGGFGYTGTAISISPPPVGGIGTFLFNEVIIGSDSGTTARVRNWDYTTNKLNISNVSGEFTAGETVVGSSSSASFKIRIIDTNGSDTGYSDNTDIQNEANNILDFSERNPFGLV